MSTKKRVTGIGGIFFKTNDITQLTEWYGKHLGISTDNFGASFISRQWNKPQESQYLQWSPMANDTDYFHPSEKGFMINYRVENLEWLVEELKKEGVTICDEIQVFDYGKFVHILDPEGNKIELWEPIDKVFDKYHIDNPDSEVNS